MPQLLRVARGVGQPFRRQLGGCFNGRVQFDHLKHGGKTTEVVDTVNCVLQDAYVNLGRPITPARLATVLVGPVPAALVGEDGAGDSGKLGPNMIESAQHFKRRFAATRELGEGEGRIDGWHDDPGSIEGWGLGVYRAFPLAPRPVGALFVANWINSLVQMLAQLIHPFPIQRTKHVLGAGNVMESVGSQGWIIGQPLFLPITQGGKDGCVFLEADGEKDWALHRVESRGTKGTD